jgi:DNA replication and repair protein RecF
VALAGPQRDDVKFLCGGVDASLALSRGQGRRAVSALILASAAAVERRLGRKPVLAFDELSSDLDAAGSAEEVRALASTGYQVFATTASENIKYDGASDIQIHVMKDGLFL